jgi:RNA polymerase sigma-70 factor (ECF subfamily)
MAVPAKPKVNTESDRLFLEMLYDSYKNLMFKQAWGYFQNQSDVEDVVQQSFVRLIMYLPTLKKLNRNTLAVYIVNVIRSCSIDLCRKRKIEKETNFSDFFEGYEETLEDDFDSDYVMDTFFSMQQLTNAISKLPEEDQFVLQAKYLQYWRDSEIAEVLGIKEDTVRTRLFRAKNRALQILAGGKNEEE